MSEDEQIIGYAQNYVERVAPDELEHVKDLIMVGVLTGLLHATTLLVEHDGIITAHRLHKIVTDAGKKLDLGMERSNWS